MKVLAIDYGNKKTGLAISDELGMVTACLPVLFAARHKYKLEGLWHVIEDVRPQIILFGVPKMINGDVSIQEKVIREFAIELQTMLKKYSLKLGHMPEIVYWDESYSSKLAEAGRSKAYIKNKSDSEAARLFLQEFLDSPDGLKQFIKN